MTVVLFWNVTKIKGRAEKSTILVWQLTLGTSEALVEFQFVDIRGKSERINPGGQKVLFSAPVNWLVPCLAALAPSADTEFWCQRQQPAGIEKQN